MESELNSIKVPPRPHLLTRPPSLPSLCGDRGTDAKRNRLLAAMTEPALNRWLPHLEAVDMPLGMVLGESGQPQRYVYFPTTSIVALMYDLEDGRTGAVSVVGNEGVVGIATFMGGGGALGRRVVINEGRGYRMRTAHLMIDFELGGPVTRVLLRYTQALISQVAQTVVCNRRHSIESRLCRLLLTTMDRLNGGSEFLLTQELMSHILGVRREGVTESALNLQQAGLLQYGRGHIKVLDRAGLERRTCECYAVVKNEYERLLPPSFTH